MDTNNKNIFGKIAKLKFLIGALVFAALVIAIPLTLSQIKKQQDTRSRASGNPVSIKFAPLTKTLQVGQRLDIVVTINTNQNDVTAADLKFTYPQDKLELISDGLVADNKTQPLTTVLNNKATLGAIRYTGVNPTGNPVTGADIYLGTLSFNAKAVGSAVVGLSEIHVNAVGQAGKLNWDADSTGNGIYTITAAGGNIRDIKGTYKHVGTCTSGCPVGQKATHYFIITEENMTTGAFSGKGFYEATPTFIWNVTGTTTGNNITYRLENPAASYIVNGTGAINAAGGADGTLTSNQNEGATWQWTKQTTCLEKPACINATPSCAIPEPMGGWCQNTNGLVGHWKMDETTGTAVSDSSGKQNNGTATGTTIVDGKLAKARKFSGVNTDYASVPDHATLKLGKQQTVAAWVKWDGAGANDWRRLVGKGGVGPRNYGLWMYPTAAGGWLYQIYDGAGASICNAQELVVPNTGWNFIVGTSDGTTAKLYRNGVLVGSVPCTMTPPISADPLTIGLANAGTQTPYHSAFNGIIDDVRIYNKALTEAEVKTLYDLGNQTSVNLSFESNGIGANPAESNIAPKRLKRQVEVIVLNSQNQEAAKVNGEVNFDPATGLYKGTVPIGNTIVTGPYLLKVRTDNSLWKQIPGIQNLTANANNQTATILLIPGDITGEGNKQDNQIDLLDYNQLITCKNNNCAFKIPADLNDDNQIEELDLSLIYAGLRARQGD